jgi:hypothetical protein
MRVRWTNELLQIEALKYNTRNEFAKNSNSAYHVALRKGLIENICSHMSSGLGYWNKDLLQIEALKYNTKVEFKRGNSAAYQTALKFGIDNFSSHMVDGINGYWNEDLLQIEALKYNTISEFKRNGGGAYPAALRRKLINKICTHMVKGDNGFNPELPAILYYIKFESKLDLPLYKIGITNLTTKDRIKSMFINKSHKPTIITEFHYENGYECVEVEKLYHKEFKEYQYLGESIMKTGNTELFIKDVLGLDFTS